MLEYRDTTPTWAWLKIAAEMIDARSMRVSQLTTEAELKAAAFIFDNGVFFLGADGMEGVKQMLLERHEREAAEGVKGATRGVEDRSCALSQSRE